MNGKAATGSPRVMHKTMSGIPSYVKTLTASLLQESKRTFKCTYLWSFFRCGYIPVVHISKVPRYNKQSLEKDSCVEGTDICVVVVMIVIS